MIRGATPGERYRAAAADALTLDARNAAAWELLTRVVEGEALSVLLLGGVGVGKTHLIAAALNELDRRYPQNLFVYWTMPRFAVERRERERRDPIHLCVEADVAFLDDLGAEYVTEWSLEGLYVVLDTRLANRKPLIVASNLTVAEIKETYGKRVLSRFYESNAHVVEVTGGDRRPRAVATERVSWLPKPPPVAEDEEPAVPMPPAVREALRALGHKRSGSGQCEGQA